jgi:hypothetical protein
MRLFLLASTASPILFVVLSSLAAAQTPSPEAAAGPEGGLENLWWIVLLVAIVAACRTFVRWASGPDNLQILYSSDAAMRQSSQVPDAETSTRPSKTSSHPSAFQDHIRPHEPV